MHDRINNLPQPNPTPIKAKITPAAERALAAGHPWVYADSIYEQSHEGDAGDVVLLVNRKRTILAVGLYDPDSPIRVKALHIGGTQMIDRDFFAGRVRAALARRESLINDPHTTGYRVLHGENDGLPGVIVDQYGGTLVLKLYSAAWWPHLVALLDALRDAIPAERLVLRLSRNIATTTHGLHDGDVLYGTQLESGDVHFIENGLHFSADVIHGHKTGFFFDQRDNRVRVGALTSGADVLDVFAYSGGFTVYAAAGAARRVLSIDISEPALKAVRHNLALNAANPKVAACQHEALAADAFDALADLARAGRRFGVVVVDPPSFASNKKQIARAIHAYERLATLAVPLVESGGLLVMASCSARVTADQFFAAVQRGAARPLDEIERTGHALDHPVAFPQAAYLKCLYARLSL